MASTGSNRGNAVQGTPVLPDSNITDSTSENTQATIANTLAMQILNSAIDKFTSGNNPSRQLMGEEINAEERERKREGSTSKAKNSSPNQFKEVGQDITKGISSQFTGMIGLLSAKLIGVLAPIAILGAAISSHLSGFSIFMSSIKILGGMIGMLMLPVFLGLSAIVLSVSDTIGEQMIPRLTEYYQYVIDVMLPASQRLYDKFMAIARATGEAIEAFQRWSKELLDWYNKKREEQGFTGTEKEMSDAGHGIIGPTINKAIRDVTGFDFGKEVLGYGGSKAKDDFGGGDWGPDDFGGGDWGDRDAKKDSADIAKFSPMGSGEPEKFSDKVARNLKLAIDEFIYQSAPKAQRSSLLEASKAAQMAALNMSPFERKLLEIQSAALAAIQNVKIQPPSTV